MKPFEDASYRAQVLRLRALAESLITRFPIRVKSLEFIHHGENATFKVTDIRGRKFLLRIHRGGYHSTDAIGEELKWLEILARTTDLDLPRPVRSKKGLLIESGTHLGLSAPRQCCVFEWTEGRFLYKSVAPKHLEHLGAVMARLQLSGTTVPVEHRSYWNAEGLLGRQPKFGSIDHLSATSPADQRIISDGRRIVYRKLKTYSKRFPERMGLIHADMHFGNVLQVNHGHHNIGVIDFDDCGFGFHCYDLAVPLIALEYILKAKRQSHRLPEYREALLSGYASYMPWDRHNEEILPYLLMARKLTMLGWIHSRSDNPRLKKRLKKAVRACVRHLRKELEL
ncbi:MAG: phosphotransferase enzyme family protein [Bdellovibrionales bacterium]